MKQKINANMKERSMIMNFSIHKSTEIRLGDKYTIEIKNIPDDGINNSTDKTLFYYRESGKPKIIDQYTTINKEVLVNTDFIFSEYDRIFVIDTNTKVVPTGKRCVGVIGELIWHEENKRYAIFKMGHILFNLDSDDNNNPERYSWAILVNYIIKLNLPALKYGVVIDSELSYLKYYNNGKPFFEDNMLPSYINFIYATADKKDTVLNWAISECDKAATNLLKQLD